MGRYLFRLPDIGEGVTEAEIVAWHVQPGARIREDDNLADVMTDKATVEMTSPVDGTVTAVHGEVGAMLAVGAVLVELEVEGEGNAPAQAEPGASVEPPAPPSAATGESRVEAAPAVAPERTSPAQAAPRTAPPPEKSRAVAGRVDIPIGPRQVFAAPATRRRAYELGIPLQFVPGTGPGGRILPSDLDDFIASGGMARAPGGLAPRTGGEDVKIVGLRRRIAERMQEAKRRIPHIAYVEEVDVTQIEALRAEMNARPDEGQPKLTLLPFLIRALVRALPDFPQVNARFDDDEGVLHVSAGVHVGIATQTPGGLMVPVLRHAEALTLAEIAREIARLSAAAREGTAKREELSGSTITITSLGPLGGIATTPVINHPEVAIIGPNRIVEKPVVQGQFVSVRKVMNISSSFDHRIVDGYDAASFIQALKRLIEHPALIFMGDGA
ncbi:dihydrolipoamide acetyltransferase family protein [Sphingobium lignivorans]|uniref:Dihydrolipoamide acetyltransferase component of pyruvate dehydrogenase complex n=1 Tax=Sphingobium lignivorans TaxID=2735886 RepID=A0ABR6NE83_9SPHN|nr:dihydrolipoamide acetyltransferase family protein [Sphingobium lignivorans]MBB5984967.1 2-oxoisovalerate dehydrogenase E2 component (dihydrolipoyl transacylase) [Sphingobium lignivorans]